MIRGAVPRVGRETWEILIWPAVPQPRSDDKSVYKHWIISGPVIRGGSPLRSSQWVQCGKWSQSSVSSGQPARGRLSLCPPDWPETIINSRNTWRILRPLNRPIKIFETNLWHWTCFVSALCDICAGERTVSGVWADLWQEMRGLLCPLGVRITE